MPDDCNEKLTLDDLVLPKDARNTIDMIISVAKSTQENPAHILLYGVPGSGKTTLAEVIADEIGMEFKSCGANVINDLVAIASMEIRNKKKNTVIFIDEIHTHPVKIQNQLLQVLQENKLIFAIDGVSRTIEFGNHFTFIVATTDRAALSEAFFSRFPNKIQFNYYEDKMMKEIGILNLKKIDLVLDDPSVNLLVKISRGVPRTIVNYVKTLRNFTIYKELSSISITEMKDFLSFISMDSDLGLKNDELLYLMCFVDTPYKALGRMSLESLTGLDKESLNNIENYFRRAHYIEMTPRGRILTKEGLDILKSKAND